MRIRTLLGPPLPHEVVRAVATALVLTDTDTAPQPYPYPPQDRVLADSSGIVPVARGQ
ncbi:hypothetical protein [Rhodococcoides fascians]|uniref:hypothetical protein n=1 Tax=Rhodococcoides fascians TaxID=1828 RepID=UPI000AC25C45|nr:hypothetical protein [Rhodococcus fascians]